MEHFENENQKHLRTIVMLDLGGLWCYNTLNYC